jgi:peptide/nickel transport system permease protein
VSDTGLIVDAPVVPTARQAWRRLLRTDTSVLSSVVFLVIVAVAGVAAPLLAPFDPYDQSLRSALLQPMSDSPEGLHVLGTDELGRDVLSRLLYGVRPLAVIVVVSVTAAAVFGLLFGLTAGYSRSWAGTAMMRIADIQLSIPPIILALLLAVAFEPGVRSAILAIAIVTWPEYARVVRAETLRVRTSEYVQLAYVAGLSRPRVLRRHIVPNIMNTFIVLVTLNLSIAIIFAAALSFLGVGVQAPTPDWGNMLAGGTRYLQSPWLVMVPGTAITLTVLALNVLGDHLRDVLDPRMGTRGKLGA